LDKISPNPPRLAKDIANFLLAIGAVLGLNTLLSFHNIWPTPWIRLQPEISVEAMAIILLLGLLGAKGLAKQRHVHCLLTAILVILIVGRYIDVTAPALYGRPINLYWDAQHVPRVAAMLIKDVSIAVLIFAGLCSAMGLMALIWSSSKLLSLLTSRGKTTQYWLTVAATLCVFSYTAGMLSNSIKFERAFSIPVSLMYMRQAIFCYQSGKADSTTEISFSNLTNDVGYVELDGRDFYLMFLESYGTTVFQNPTYFAQIKPGLEHLSQVAEEHDWHTTTGIYQAPTFGGASWLSHATLMSGQWISTNTHYHKLLTTNSRTLAQWFQNSGYRAAALLPGLKHQWPEGRFYGYDRIWNAKSLPYPGPTFGWWAIPDQYSLAYFYDNEGTMNPRDPLFSFFATITSHMPFHPLPPIQQHWPNLLSSQPYPHVEQVIKPSGVLYGNDLQTSYNRAIVYDLHLVSDLLRLTSHQNPLIIALGDHQPPAMIAGVNAPWTVPVHVFSQNRETLGGFTAAGFVSGLIPNDTSLGRLDELHHLILNAAKAKNNHLINTN
jgi:hypothetical protein